MTIKQVPTPFLKILLVIFLLVTSPCTGWSQANEGFAVSVTHESDALSLDDDRQNYTGGIRVDLQTPRVKIGHQPFLISKGKKVVNVQAFSLGTTGFTPQDVLLTEVDVDDRPYASFAFLSAGLASYNLDKGSIWRSQLMMGTIGGALQGKIQNSLVSAFGGRPLAEGWDNQVGHPGSFALQYNASYTKASFHSSQIFLRHFLNKLHIEHDTLNLVDADLIAVDSLMKDRTTMRELSELLSAETGFEFLRSNWKVNVNAGMYMTNASFVYEFDLFNLNRYALLNYIPDEIKAYGPLHQTHHMHGEKDLFRFNIFVRPALKLVGYNAMLEGLLLNDHSTHLIQSSDVSQVLFELEAGFNLLIAHRVNLIYSWFGRTREFEGGRAFNKWGGLTLGFSPGKWHE